MADQTVRRYDAPTQTYVDARFHDNGDGSHAEQIYAASLPLPSGAATAANQNPNPTTVAEYNVTLTNANTEYSQALPANCKALAFRCRTSAAVRYAWVTGKVATPAAPYQTLKADAEYWKEGIKLVGGTIYLASATAGVVVEIEAWS